MKKIIMVSALALLWAAGANAQDVYKRQVQPIIFEFHFKIFQNVR